MEVRRSRQETESNQEKRPFAGSGSMRNIHASELNGNSVLALWRHSETLVALWTVFSSRSCRQIAGGRAEWRVRKQRWKWPLLALRCSQELGGGGGGERGAALRDM